MAQRAPEGSMKQVLRPILIYLSPRSPNNNHQQPFKNDLHFGGLLRGMLRGYASGYASGVCFARAPPPTNTYLGPREKILTHIYIYVCVYICVYVCACMCVCVYVCMCVCVHVCMYVCMYVGR